jgi:hypothetical protein
MSDDQSIQVQLGANVSDLQAGMEQGAAAVEAGADQMSESIEGLSAVTAEATRQMESSFVGFQESINASMESASEKVSEAGATIRERLEGIAESISAVQKTFALLGEVAIAGFIGEQIIELARGFAEYGEQVEIAAAKTGMTTDAVQQLNFAANMSGVSAQQMEQGMVRLSRAMVNAEQGSVQAKTAFAELGLSAGQLKDMSLDQVLAKVADKFAGWEDGANKTAIATQLFGRAGADLIPVLDKGSDGLDELKQRASDLGLVLSSADIEAATKLNETFKELDAEGANLKLRVGEELAPAFQLFMSRMVESYNSGGLVKQVLEAIGEVATAVEQIILTLVAAFDQLTAIGSGTFTSLGDLAQGFGQIIQDVFGGDLTKAGADFKKFLDKADQDMAAAVDKAAATGAKWQADMEATSGNGQEGQGAGGIDMGVEQKTQPPIMQKGQGQSQVAEWREQLQEQQDASNEFFKSNLAGDDAFWSQKLALTSAGSKDWLAVMHELYAVHKQEAQQDLAADLESIRAQMAAEQAGSQQRVALAQQAAKEVGAAYGEGSKEYLAAMATVNKESQAYALAQVKIQDDAIKQIAALQLNEVAVDAQNEKTKVALHQESAQQEIANLAAAENQKYAITMAELNQEMALYSQHSKDYQKLLDEKLKAETAHASELAKLNTQSATAYQQAWNQTFGRVNGMISSSVMGMINHTQTFQQAMTKMADQVLSSFVTLCLQTLEHWAASEIMKTAATVAGNAARTTATAAAATAGLAAEGAAAKSSVGSAASRAAANVYADVAEIPYVGWLLAPPAAAAAFVAVEAFGGGIASAAGGLYQVPNDMFANIHKDEMVLPAWAASGVRNMIGGGGGGGGGGNTVNVNSTLNNTAMNDTQFKSMLMKHADVIVQGVSKQLRNFQGLQR